MSIEKWPGLKYEILWEFARSRGPGGQNVNKTNSAAIARWSVAHSKIFSIEQKEILIRKLANKLTLENELLIRSDEFRDQERNKDRCYEKLNELLELAFFVPKKRRPTKPTYSSKKKRLETKKIRGDIKSGRQAKWSSKD